MYYLKYSKKVGRFCFPFLTAEEVQSGAVIDGLFALRPIRFETDGGKKQGLLALHTQLRPLLDLTFDTAHPPHFCKTFFPQHLRHTGFLPFFSFI